MVELEHVELIHQTFTTARPDDIFTTELKISPESKNTIIQTIKEGGDKQNRESNVKACMTDWNMEKEPGFLELNKYVTDIVNYIHAFDNVNCALEVFNMWGLLYKKDDFAQIHDHTSSVWSGVFYLDIPTDYAGALVFPELEHYIEPVTGQLVLFRGTTRHGVNIIKSTQERLAVSFNYNASLK